MPRDKWSELNPEQQQLTVVPVALTAFPFCRLSHPEGTTGDRSMRFSSRPCARLARCSKSSPREGRCLTCPCCLPLKTQTMLPAPTADADLLPEQLRDIFPNAKPSRTGPHPHCRGDAAESVSKCTCCCHSPPVFCWFPATDTCIFPTLNLGHECVELVCTSSEKLRTYKQNTRTWVLWPVSWVAPMQDAPLGAISPIQGAQHGVTA